MNPAPVTVVMPTFNEAVALGRSLRALRDQDALRELIIIDGPSQDETRAVIEATRPGFESRKVGLLWSETQTTGRAAQMNEGAGKASGAILLFVHADTILPEGAVAAVAESIQKGYVGGAFRHRFVESGPGLAAVSFWSNLRSRLTHVFFGDQAIFVRKDLFDMMGGFRPLPIMEDLEFSRRLRARGRTRLVPLRVSTSARRFLAEGVGSTCARMVCLRTAYRLGADPGRLKRHYPEVR